jgi:hypothetical protein
LRHLKAKLSPGTATQLSWLPLSLQICCHTQQ